MRTISKVFRLALISISIPAVPAAAQPSLIANAGVAAIVDDETFLGRGPVAGAGVAWAFGTHVSVEGEASIARHHRDAGYLAAEGTQVVAAGRLVYTFGATATRVRPFASGGAVVVHSTGFLTSPSSSIPFDPFKRATLTSERRDWTLTQGGLEVGAGLLIRVSERLAIRPEFRWIATGPDPASRATIEPPLWIAKPSVSIVWRIR